MWPTTYFGSAYDGPAYWGQGSAAIGGPMPLDCYGAVPQSLDSDPLGVDADSAVLTG